MDIYWFIGWILILIFSKRGSQEILKNECRELYDSSWTFFYHSRFAVYSSHIEMEGKVSNPISEYTLVSAIQPKGVLFTMLVLLVILGQTNIYMIHI